MMLATLRRQWSALRRLDHFRREGVSNLSHDLRSPLTATVACLETLDARWAGDAPRARGSPPASRWRCATPAMRRGWCNRSAIWPSSTSRSSGCTRVASTSANCSTTSASALPSRLRRRSIACARVHAPKRAATPPYASLDIELFERAIANLIDNALKFCAARVDASSWPPGRSAAAVEVSVSDDGPGIAAADLPYPVRSVLPEPAERRAGDRRGRQGSRPGDRQAHRRTARRRGHGRRRAGTRHTDHADPAGRPALMRNRRGNPSCGARRRPVQSSPTRRQAP